jgi:hypothetical protein
MATSIKTNTLNPIPVRDSIVGMSDKDLNQPWELWFRKLFDVVSGMSTVKTGSNTTNNGTSSNNVQGFNYTIDGNRYFFNYNGSGNVSISLPFPVLYSVNYTDFSITAGDTKITIPPLTAGTILNEWFFLNVT